MLPQAHRGLRRATADAVRLIDSTSIRLSSLSESWATFSADVFGADANAVTLITADGAESWPRQAKSSIARMLAGKIAQTLDETSAR